MLAAFNEVFKGIPVLVTGHTGFKGSWLSIWLKELGAEVIGYSLDPPTVPSNFNSSRLDSQIYDVRNDIRSFDALCEMFKKFEPQIVFHLAAQAIVRESYANPKDTFDINVGGTINVLEAIRQSDSVKAAVFITSDKCYENQEWLWGYRETDRLGGYDPYSSSKAMAELAIAAYRRSFFPPEQYKEHGVAVASTRAGNVIGGGDWAKDRIVSDCMRALMSEQSILVRNPNSVRPWQFVLEPLSGYLWLAVKLLEEGDKFSEAWNFGPPERIAISVKELVLKLIEIWGKGNWQDVSTGQVLHEAGLLRLSWEKAANLLEWQPAYTCFEAIRETVMWFKKFHSSGSNVDMYATCVEQIEGYTDHARELGIAWAR